MGKDNAGFELGRGLSQSKDGTYLARVTLKNGVRRQKSFQTIKSAKRWLNGVKQGNNSVEQAYGTTVGQWYDTWIEVYKVGKIKDSSIETYTYHYLKYIDGLIGNKLVDEITTLDCQRVINNASRITKSTKEISAVRTLLYSVMDGAYQNGMIDKNPLTKMVSLPRAKKKEMRVLTKEEQALFVDALDGCRYRSQFLLMLNTGMRVGEVCGLKWQDIDFKSNTINIERTLTRVGGKMVESEPKTEHSYRLIPMNESVVNILTTTQRTSEYVFVNSKNAPIERNSYNQVLYRLCDSAGLERFSCHTLRHTFATRCIEAGMKPKILQKILGHATISITMDLYVHATDDEISNQMKLVGNIAI